MSARRRSPRPAQSSDTIAWGSVPTRQHQHDDHTAPVPSHEADDAPDPNEPSPERALRVPGCNLDVDEIHFLLWYQCITTLSPDQIAKLFNVKFKKSIDRFLVQDAIHHLEAKWLHNGKKFGKFRLNPPTDFGACPCDFKLKDGPDYTDCDSVKRSKDTRQNKKYLEIAESLWSKTAFELVQCRGQRLKTGSKPVVTQHGLSSPGSLQARYLEVVDALQNITKLTVTFGMWLLVISIWFEPEYLQAVELQVISTMGHSYPAPWLAAVYTVVSECNELLSPSSPSRTISWQSLPSRIVSKFLGAIIAFWLVIEVCLESKVLPAIVMHKLS